MSTAATGPARTSTVEWVPGSDRLLGRCSCGASTEADEPVGVWQWLLAHPSHPTQPPTAPDPVADHVPPAHRVHHPAQAAGPRAAAR